MRAGPAGPGELRSETMKRLLLLCLTAAVLVSCLGLSAQAAPTLSWTESYIIFYFGSAQTFID